MARRKQERGDRSVKREGALHRARPIAQVLGVSVVLIGSFVVLGFYLDRDKGKVEPLNGALPSYSVGDVQKAMKKVAAIQSQGDAPADASKGDIAVRRLSDADTALDNATGPQTKPKAPAKAPTVAEVQKARTWVTQLKQAIIQTHAMGGGSVYVDYDILKRLPVSEQVDVVKRLDGRSYEKLIKDASEADRAIYQEARPEQGPVSFASGEVMISRYLESIAGIEVARRAAPVTPAMLQRLEKLEPPTECIAIHQEYQGYLRAKVMGVDEEILRRREKVLKESLRLIQQSYSNLSDQARTFQIGS